MIKLLLDMGVPRRSADDLAALGWDVSHIGEGPSVIHIRIQGLAHSRTTATIREVTGAIESDLEAGCIATVTDAGVRVRRLPLR